MANHQENASLPSSRIPDSLSDALRTETRLYETLITVLCRQREGVSADDLQQVEETVHSANRILRTLEEAGRRRRYLLKLMTGNEDTPLRDLPLALGDNATPSLRSAQMDLQRTTRALARDIALNRRILEDALRAADEHIRTVCGLPLLQLLYELDSRRPDK